MVTRAIDLATMGRALHDLSAQFLGDVVWNPQNDEQARFLAWCAANREQVASLVGYKSSASTDYAILNCFMEKEGYGPQFTPFEGVGIASLFGATVNWPVKGTLASISRWGRPTETLRHGVEECYSAFHIALGVDAFEVLGLQDPLIRIGIRGGHYLWLMKTPEPTSDMALAKLAQIMLTSDRLPNLAWHSVKIPMLEIEVQPDISWLIGTNTTSPQCGYQRICQVIQRYRLRINEPGARIMITPSFAGRREDSGARPYVFDDPFMGFFTQSESGIARGAFYADIDSWRNSEGTLEEI
ncbi:MAG TPA: hypothetical protein VFT16_03410 [Candidatus Saccharimonadales bacterium]|nr:hypothetical protein [Candidatus Saccharimonadales bacterium]